MRNDLVDALLSLDWLRYGPFLAQLIVTRRCGQAADPLRPSAASAAC